MIKHSIALAVALTAVTLASPSSAATQVVQTLDTDGSWKVQNLTLNSPIVDAIVPNVVPNVYFGPGGAAGGSNKFNTPYNGAVWIYGDSGIAHAQNNTFTFTKFFTLPGTANLASALLSGKFWSDNGIVSIVLNGVNLITPVLPGTAGNAPGGPGPNSTYGSATGTFFSSNLSGATFGYSNTLVFTVQNGAGTGLNPVATLADIDVTAAVPEPGTWMLMLLGFGAIGFAMRSRAKTQVRFQFA